MAKGVWYCCKKTEYNNKSIHSRYASLLAGKKTAHKSKGVKGITLKKKSVEKINDFGMGLMCRSRDLISGCVSVDDYETLNEISHGSFGIVYRARDTKTGEIVAIKEEFDGLCFSSLREIDILKSLHHPSIVEFKQVAVDDYDGVYVVMEYVENDLHEYLKRPLFSSTSLSEVKRLMKELLEGVKYLHQNRVMHRDLKPSNILINSKGELKICDFGMSRQFGSIYSPRVVTLWYRAPELLLGMKTYSFAIDMWSVGCIMAELLSKQVLFRGESEIDQLHQIYRVLGTPNETVWPGYSKLPGSRANFVRQPYNNLLCNKLFLAAILSDFGYDLLEKLLSYDPEKRITAEDALRHGWFDE
ncbi:hypothetical protein DH2020_043246 [Rehmannia glutinosa]|uniref:Protein kinase domain-containing protein n=1 Tax=Rehmannia glutinosa TaxID=99300 RepID=A0ABR0UL42_REHGL